jgi:hypothetical protein
MRAPLDTAPSRARILIAKAALRLSRRLAFTDLTCRRWPRCLRAAIRVRMRCLIWAARSLGC